MEEKNLETKIDGAETTTQIEETNVPQNETHDSKPVVEEKEPNDKKQEEQEKVDDVKDEETKIKEAIQKRLENLDFGRKNNFQKLQTLKKVKQKWLQIIFMIWEKIVWAKKKEKMKNLIAKSIMIN